ncbi:MAG TPA: PDZ domain-containing protein [Pyrinomonadaceae bacterium]|nr:PDZ domain-containing protein [Pyrinomonadaceae bacterium]
MKQAIQHLFVALALLTTGQSVWAQATSRPSAQQPLPTAPTAAAPQGRKARAVRRPTVVVEDRWAAPQVVTILHRLNGLKMFRLLIRSGEEIDAITRLDDAFKMKDEVHTSVIAGVAMGDGETIAARLPQADAELGPAMAPAAPPAPPSPLRPGSTPVVAETGLLGGVNNFFDRPDLTVIGRNGKRLFARYIGLDGVTGLSVLKLSGHSALAQISNRELPVAVGQKIRLLAPEPVGKVDQRLPNRINVRIGETEARVIGVTRAPSGAVARIKVTSNNLSPAAIGGVAINEAGETVGIVEAVDRAEATLLPSAMVHSAAKRVLDKQASVPRPWLGIRGEPLGTFPLEQMVRGGWQPEMARSLWQEHRGIFLTSVAPGSPAAGAALRPGDVILRVNESEVKNADEFSWSLEEISAGNPVNFTVARPGQPTNEAVEVTLSNGPVGFSGSTEDGATSADINVERIVRSFNGAANSLAGMLMSEGIETIALKPAVAMRFGAGSGLLVVYVNPQTVAYKSGLRTGDVIEAINGRAVLSDAIKLLIAPGSDYALNVVRNREKLVVKIAR